MTKKISFRSIAFGCTLLSAAIAGAWFLFTPDTEEIQQTPVIINPAKSSPYPQRTVREELDFFQDADIEDIEDETETTGENTLEELRDISEQSEGIDNNIQDGISETEKDTEIKEEESKNSQKETAEERPVTAAETTSSPDVSVIKAVAQEEKEEISQAPAGLSCEQVSPVLSSFFNNLERKDYSEEFNIKQPIFTHFNELTTKLFANPPVVIHETDELYTILTNMAHFFRILGKKDVLLVRSVLDREKENIEDVATELYRLSSTETKRCFTGGARLDIPFVKMYEYAGFFLNTMGGRSYLFRRDSRSRLLVNYYAIQIVEQANRKNLNSYGLDISEIIPWLIREMEESNQLAYKERYLDRLYELAEKYQVEL